MSCDACEPNAGCTYCDNGEAAGTGLYACVCPVPCWNPDCPRVRHPINTPTKQTAPARPPSEALAQWTKERAALVKCARALAFTYGGSHRPDESDPEGRAMWDAMTTAYGVLGVNDTRDLP